MRGLAQVEQCPKPNRLRVKWLAAPLEFLSFCSEVQGSNDLFCQDHAQEDAAPTAAAIHAREVCHVEGKLAVSVWVSLADAAWPATCQRYVQSYCARTCLATWSTKEMDESLGRLQEEFTVCPDQAGFFQSPSERLQPEAVAREQREIDGALPHQARKSDERKRKVRRGYEDVPPFVLKVVQDCACSLVCRGFFGVHGCFAQIAPSQPLATGSPLLECAGERARVDPSRRESYVAERLRWRLQVCRGAPRHEALRAHVRGLVPFRAGLLRPSLGVHHRRVPGNVGVDASAFLSAWPTLHH